MDKCIYGNNLEPKELISNIRRAILNAKKSIAPAKNIKRGTSHPISSIAEDLFASYLQSKVNNKFEIWIDPQISVEAIKNNSGKRALLIRPDVCIVNVKNNTIEMIFEIKVDLGFKRKTFISYVRERNSLLSKILKQKHKGKCILKKEDLYFSSDLHWNFIVISKGNISDTQYSEIESFFRKNKKAKLFTLSSGKGFRKNAGVSQEFIEKDFNELNNELKKLSTSK